MVTWGKKPLLILSFQREELRDFSGERQSEEHLQFWKHAFLGRTKLSVLTEAHLQRRAVLQGPVCTDDLESNKINIPILVFQKAWSGWARLAADWGGPGRVLQPSPDSGLQLSSLEVALEWRGCSRFVFVFISFYLISFIYFTPFYECENNKWLFLETLESQKESSILAFFPSLFNPILPLSYIIKLKAIIQL